MSNYNGYKALGAGMLVGLGVLVGHCTTDHLAKEELIRQYQNRAPTIVNTNGGDYINAQDHSIAMKSTTENNYNSKNSGNSNNGVNTAPKSSSTANYNDLVNRVRVAELEVEKLKNQKDATPEANLETQTETITIYTTPGAKGDATIDDTKYVAYQNKNHPDIIILLAGKTSDKQKNKRVNVLENHNGNVRYNPINWDRERSSFEVMPSMSIHGFLGYYGNMFSFDGQMLNVLRLQQSWYNNLPEFVPRSGSSTGMPYGNGKH